MLFIQILKDSSYYVQEYSQFFDFTGLQTKREQVHHCVKRPNQEYLKDADFNFVDELLL